MKLLLIIAILLFQKSKVTEHLKRCWGEYIQGYCRKICRISEIRQVLCENGRYCCLNIMELEARRKITKPTRPKPKTYAVTLPQDDDTFIENYSRITANST
ncbi:beta-defensin 127-like [Ursus americanus]|uniref:Beta-defensin n=3 Tax=Ursidae TaxID=9632 RepID=G1LXR3_AILME|nr:beta-defensin 127 [Ailuropoda melanoleuca]XP_008701621.1 beta-defensin 127 [Ursus maritimus]XP_044241554.1 beta-defensin 127 [Ursus arctos]XP_045663307.1 beta-defensin 127-like [Ursus americanus]